MTIQQLDQEVCPKCEKVAYEAESLPAGNHRFHKRCFKCLTCDQKLDSMRVRVHDGKLYCKACHKKTYPDETPKIYTDTTQIQPEDGKGCPRCGGTVFEAEKVTVKDDVYHKRCFNCKRCCRPCDSLLVSVAPDGDIYCKVCYKVVTAPDRPQMITDTAMIQAEEEKEGCPRCGGKVFEAEKMTAKIGVYHRKCFTCAECKRALDYQLCTEGPDSEIYCRNCYSFKHGHKAKPNLHDADVTVIQGDDGETGVCPRCSGKVFEAEKQIAKSGWYHRKCFTCCKCKHQVDATNFANGPDNDVYCVFCYKVTHGHKAPTRSMPLDTTSIEGDTGDKATCPRCTGKVFAAEKMVAASGWYHRHCFRCSFCSQPLDSTSVCDGPDNKIYCRVCYKRLRGSSKPRFLDEANIETWTIQGGDNDNPCPRCNGKVFEAEKMISMRHVYHKKCFTCRDCTRPMDQFIACDAPDGEIVCKPCYLKKYSCTAYQMSGGDMLKFLNTAIIMGDEGDKEACPRCGGKVFHAERITVKNRNYHKKCACCKVCAQPLNSRNICDGKDHDIYCKSCYARKFGAPGYRGAGAGDWTDADSAETLRPVQNIDTGKIKGDEDDPDTCPRCKGKIFETERKASRHHHWHKKCFNCCKCGGQFDGTMKYVYDGSDGEIYCKLCFKKYFPESETPLIHADTSTLKPDGGEGGCPRCEGSVFQAEEVVVKGRSYHKQCMTCRNCKRLLDIHILAIGPDDDLYCTICCHKISWPGAYQGAPDTTTIPGEEGEPTNCPRCSGKVFEAEKMNTKRGFYHKKCFACIKCRHQLDYFSAIEGPDDEVYCRICYLKNYGPGGANKYGDKTPFQVDEGDPEACGRCKNKVFEAEKIVTKGGLWHKYCLSCNECKCNLDASSFFSAPDLEVYCRHCYAVNFGHRMKSDYKGWMDVQAIMGDEGDKMCCPRCKGKVFEAERMVTRIGSYHKNCFSCIECTKKLDSVSCCEGPDCEIYCDACYSLLYGTKARSRPKNFRRRARSVPKLYQNQDDILARSTIETWVIKGEAGDPDVCPKCVGKVYEAEKMVTASGKWYHKNCFRCIECSRQLDSLTNNDGPDGGLYCKSCYSKNFGPQTRSSDIDHKQLITSTIKSEDPKKNCPRCGGAVFSAEEIFSKGKSYHKRCANCKACEKKLDHGTVFNGEDGDIYCKNCYHRKFAPSGFRGAGCADWVDNESANVLRHSYQAF